VSTSSLGFLVSWLAKLATHTLGEMTGAKPCHSWHALERALAQPACAWGCLGYKSWLGWLMEVSRDEVMFQRVTSCKGLSEKKGKQPWDGLSRLGEIGQEVDRRSYKAFLWLIFLQ
jgi:hypothetical protein